MFVLPESKCEAITKSPSFTLIIYLYNLLNSCSENFETRDGVILEQSFSTNSLIWRLCLFNCILLVCHYQKSALFQIKINSMLSKTIKFLSTSVVADKKRRLFFVPFAVWRCIWLAPGRSNFLWLVQSCSTNCKHRGQLIF